MCGSDAAQVVVEGDEFMDAALIILVILTIKDCVFGKQKTQDEYLSVRNTLPIKGLFTILIIFSHYVTYYTPQGSDSIYRMLKSHLSQAVVIPYLVYSGYGMAYRLKQKGKDYLGTILRRRIPQVLLGVAAALVLFFVLGLLRNQYFSWQTILLSLIGWESLGNSNWYIFGIIGEYVIFWISFQVLRIRDNKQTRLAGLLLTTLLTAAFVIWIRWMGRPTWFYNTLAMFPLGVAWGLYHEKVDRLLHEKSSLWLLALAITIGVYELGVLQRNVNLVWYTVFCAAFAVAMLLLSMRIQLNSPVLDFFGKHVFSVYILQRLFMIILTDWGWTEQKPYLSLILVILCTSTIAIGFDWVMDKLYKKLHLK
jgi:hypothetical protein